MTRKVTLVITILSAFILAIITSIIFLYKIDNSYDNGSNPIDSNNYCNSNMYNNDNNLSNMANYSKINRTVFINKLDDLPHFKYELFYSNIDSSEMAKVTYTPSSISYSSIPLTPYGTGFLETPTHNEIINLINTNRVSVNLPKLKSIFSYNTFGDLTFVSTSSGLDTLYIVNITKQTVSSPITPSHFKLGPLYVYDIKETQDKYYILTAGVNSLDAKIYSLSKDTLVLSEVLTTITDNTALSPLQFSLTNHGDGLFTNSNGVQINNTILNLDFTPCILATYEDISIALSSPHDEGYINATIIDNSSYDILTNYNLITTPSVEMLHCDVDENFIYILSYDHLNPLYRYYLNIYDIQNGNLLFSEGLTDYSNLRILDIKK